MEKPVSVPQLKRGRGRGALVEALKTSEATGPSQGLGHLHIPDNSKVDPLVSVPQLKRGRGRGALVEALKTSEATGPSQGLGHLHIPDNSKVDPLVSVPQLKRGRCRGALVEALKTSEATGPSQGLGHLHIPDNSNVDPLVSVPQLKRGRGRGALVEALKTSEATGPSQGLGHLHIPDNSKVDPLVSVPVRGRGRAALLEAVKRREATGPSQGVGRLYIPDNSKVDPLVSVPQLKRGRGRGALVEALKTSEATGPSQGLGHLHIPDNSKVDPLVFVQGLVRGRGRGKPMFYPALMASGPSQGLGRLHLAGSPKMAECNAAPGLVQGQGKATLVAAVKITDTADPSQDLEHLHIDDSPGKNTPPLSAPGLVQGQGKATLVAAVKITDTADPSQDLEHLHIDDSPEKNTPPLLSDLIQKLGFTWFDQLSKEVVGLISLEDVDFFLNEQPYNTQTLILNLNEVNTELYKSSLLLTKARVLADDGNCKVAAELCHDAAITLSGKQQTLVLNEEESQLFSSYEYIFTLCYLLFNKNLEDHTHLTEEIIKREVPSAWALKYIRASVTKLFGKRGHKEALKTLEDVNLNAPIATQHPAANIHLLVLKALIQGNMGDYEMWTWKEYLPLLKALHKLSETSLEARIHYAYLRRRCSYRQFLHLGHAQMFEHCSQGMRYNNEIDQTLTLLKALLNELTTSDGIGWVVEEMLLTPTEEVRDEDDFDKFYEMIRKGMLINHNRAYINRTASFFYELTGENKRACELLSYADKLCGSKVAKMELVGLMTRCSRTFRPNLTDLSTLAGGAAQVASYFLLVKNDEKKAQSSIKEYFNKNPECPSIQIHLPVWKRLSEPVCLASTLFSRAGKEEKAADMRTYIHFFMNHTHCNKSTRLNDRSSILKEGERLKFNRRFRTIASFRRKLQMGKELVVSVPDD